MNKNQKLLCLINKIVDNKIVDNKVVDNKITANKVVDNKITANKVVDNKITTNKVVDNKITTNKVAFNKITTNKVAFNKITINKLAYNKIITNKLAYNKIITNKLVYNKVIADSNINNNNITNKIDKQIENIKIINDIFCSIITIVSPDCLLFISNIFSNYFIKMGWKCNIINQSMFYNYNKQYSTYPNHYFFIYCIHLIDFNILNKNKYIIYQLEQNTIDISIHYKKLMDSNKLRDIFLNSKINLDYATENINLFQEKLKTTHYLLHMPIKNKKSTYNCNKEYDLIFIGSINERRNNILKKLKEKYNLYIPDKPVYKEELYKLLKKCKILINIHYYEHCILETPRLNEALISGIKIISEKSFIMTNDYENSIEFIEIINEDLSELYSKIDSLLNNYLPNNNENIIIKLEEQFINEMKIYFDINNFSIFKNEIAVISSNFGSYDDLPSNLNIIKNYNYFDWFYFVDNKLQFKNIETQSKWNIIEDYSHLQNEYNIHNNKNMMYSKYYKVQSNNIALLSKYKYIIWIDASIIIKNTNFVSDILNLIQKNSNENMFIFEHFSRTNIFDEYLASKHIPKYNSNNMYDQVKNYKDDNFDNHNLYEAGFFIYKNNEKMKETLNAWWNEIVKFSFQDQLSLPYILKKNNINPYLLNESNFIKTKLEGSVWKNKLIGYVRKHK